MSTQDINKALGLSDGGIDEFLGSLTLDDTKEKLSKVDDAIKQDVDEIDSQMQQYNSGGLSNIDIVKLDSSFSEMKELIEVSKMTIKHVYESVVTSELVDSELVQALSKLLEATHLSISEYISMYKSRMAFYDKVRMEQLKQKYKLEQMDYKHKLDMEKLNAIKKSDAVDVPNNMVAYSQEDLIREIDKVKFQ